jgi:hypothetical protein
MTQQAFSNNFFAVFLGAERDSIGLACATSDVIALAQRGLCLDA